MGISGTLVAQGQNRAEKWDVTSEISLVCEQLAREMAGGGRGRQPERSPGQPHVDSDALASQPSQDTISVVTRLIQPQEPDVPH